MEAQIWFDYWVVSLCEGTDETHSCEHALFFFNSEVCYLLYFAIILAASYYSYAPNKE
ncbi:unnamed protein product [Prunus brigantina]